jgi:dihydrofolate reductase
MPDRKVILYIATSLDGYITKPNDDLDFLSIVEQEGQDYGYVDFINTVDTVILGRKTYDWVLSKVQKFPHADKETYVITRSSKPSIGNVRFYNGNIKELVLKLKQESGQNIFVDGGAEIVNALLNENLIDEFIISIIPVLTGSGVRLFQEERPEQQLKLVESNHFDTGLVQLHYKKDISSNLSV